jgi:hypothetical protein
MAASREELAAMGRGKVEEAAERSAATEARQHSPQEREIERYEPWDPPSKLEWVSCPTDGHWVKYEDHLAALQDREAELEKERDAWEKGKLAVTAEANREEDRANRAEAALREAKAEFEKQAKASYRESNTTEGEAAKEVWLARHQSMREAAGILDTSIGKPCECGGSGEIPTGECRVAMSGPTCSHPDCPPCQTPETEPCPDCKPPAPEDCSRCKGRGWFRVMRDVGQGEGPAVACSTCSGTGTKPPAPCSARASAQGGSDDVGDFCTIDEEEGPLGPDGEPLAWPEAVYVLREMDRTISACIVDSLDRPPQIPDRLEVCRYFPTERSAPAESEGER